MALQTGVLLRPLAVMMTRDLKSISEDATLLEAAVLMRDAKVGALLVTSGPSYVGIITERDLVRKAMAGSMDLSGDRVKSVMSAPVISIEMDRSAHDASDLMAERNIRHLAVTQDGQLIGMISVRDLLHYFKNWGTL
jgi:CBS domain-containing protein